MECVICSMFYGIFENNLSNLYNSTFAKEYKD